jgi:pseudouridine-5'-phosphate glycosidase
VETALQVEQTVREQGAVPATIAVLSGKLRVGLTVEEIDYLGKKGTEVIKCSRRDLPFVVTQGLDGATTVAATMIIAEMADIQVFATGGVGGVHRGAQETFDISADLQELARTRVAVVCAGAKSILDLPLTLEYLETHGVPVIGWQTDEFPAFYTRQSGLPVDYRFDSIQDLAEALRAKWDMQLQGGAVIANPIPTEFSMPKAKIDSIIEQALAEAARKGIKGKEVTPFLLAKIEALTGGKSLVANIQLVLNNARLAALLARALV